MAPNAIANLLLRITSEEGDAERGLSKLFAAMKAFSGVEADAEVNIKTEQARANLDEIRASLAKFARETVSANADINTGLARFHLEELEVALERLDHETVTIDTDVAIAGALSKITTFRAALAALGSEGGPDRRELASQANSISSAISGIGRTLKTTERDSTSFFSNFTDGLKNAKTSIGPLSLTLQNLGRALDILIPVIGALGAGLIALGASAGAALAGVGALATAAVAAGGPILALAIGTVARFTSASTALADYRSKIQAVRSVEQALTTAEASLRDAQISANRAQTDLTKARADAAQNIQDALTSAINQQQSAEFSLTEAQHAQLDAQEALTQARQDAQRALVSLRLASADAATAEKQSRLDLLEAQQSLAALEKAGITGLPLREARLKVEEAENGVADAKNKSKTTQEDLNDAEKKGVSQSSQVVAAKRQLESANHNLTTSQNALQEATQKLLEVQDESVRSDSQVISAKQQLADANRQVADAQTKVSFETRKLTHAQNQLNRAQKLAEPLLSGVGKRLRQSIRQLRNAFFDMIKFGSNRIWRGVADAIEQIIPLMHNLRDDFGFLGRAIGDAFRKIAKTFSSPVWERFFSFFIRSAAKLVPIATKSFLALARIFVNIARASMPFLLSALRELGDLLGGVGKSTSNIAVIRGAIAGLVSQAASWLNLFVQLARVIFQIGRAAAGPGQSLVDWLAAGAQGFADWASTTEGQQSIKKFFDDMLPLFKQLVVSFIKLVELAVKWSEIMAPTMTLVFQILNRILTVFNAVSGVLADLPDSVKLVAGAFLLFKGPVGVIKLLVGGIRTLIGIFAGGAIVEGLSGMGASIAGLVARVGGLSAAIGALGGITLVGGETFLIFDKLQDAINETKEAQDKLDRDLAAGPDPSGAWQAQQDAISGVEEALKGVQSREQALEVLRRQFGRGAGDIPWERLAREAHKQGGLTGEKWLQAVQDKLTKQGREVLPAGRKIGDIVAEGMRSSFAGRVRSILSSITSVIGNLSPIFRKAGGSIITSIVEGIKAFSPRLGAAIKAGSQLLRNILPGSEPRDPSSPLRNLSAAGEAIVKNIAEGITRAHSEAPRLLASRLAVDVMGSPHKHAGGGASTTVNHNQFDMRPHVQGVGLPDPDVWMAAVSRNLRKRGLSLSP